MNMIDQDDLTIAVTAIISAVVISLTLIWSARRAAHKPLIGKKSQRSAITA